MIKIALKFVPKGPIDKIATLVQTMAWRRAGNKPLSEPMVISLLTHIGVARPQRVNNNTSGDARWHPRISIHEYIVTHTSTDQQNYLHSYQHCHHQSQLLKSSLELAYCTCKKTGLYGLSNVRSILDSPKENTFESRDYRDVSLGRGIDFWVCNLTYFALEH